MKRSAPLFEHRVRLPAHRVPKVLHAQLHRFWAGCSAHARLIPRDVRFATELATVEIASNVAVHALERTTSPMRLRFALYPNAIDVWIRDHGHPVTWPIALPREPMAESGRGLVLSMLAMDAVAYARTTNLNVWRLTKRIVPVPD